MQAEARLLLASPGDFILWDSRTVHGGLVGPGAAPQEQTAEVPRMSVPICMTPKSLATPEVLESRRQGFKLGVCFNHWPHYTDKAAGAIKAATMAAVVTNYTPIELTPEQDALL